MYHQAERGALPAQVWARWRSTIAWWMANPGIQAWWEAKPTPLSSDFEAFVAERIEDGVEDPAARAR